MTNLSSVCCAIHCLRIAEDRSSKACKVPWSAAFRPLQILVVAMNARRASLRGVRT